ncbi:MAG: zinc metallopeptidase [Bacteroidetes bacterium]|nr:zinc metallopeptidase [Bacteroidota bacterium]MCB9043902.1 zinc metallopeptidase [Chitinophagales bacterium]
MIIIAVSMGASALVGGMLRKRFKEYSQISLRSGMSGKEVAEKMLRDNGIDDVQVISVQGQLTDHYNPANKTVNLSEGVYAQRNVAAAAVAAHECGHAVQHAQAYPFLQMRSKLVPMVGISSNLAQYAIMGGIILYASSGIPWVLMIGVALFAMTTLFAFVTLPVEFDASNRALKWMQSAGITTGQEQDKAFSALKWAAMTYVVAALASLAQLLYFASYLFRGNND